MIEVVISYRAPPRLFASRQACPERMSFIAEQNSHYTEAEVTRIALAGRRFIKDEEGAALAEYGILVAFIAIVAITAVTFFGSKISAKFSALANSFT